MVTFTALRCNTSCDLPREEREEYECNGIGFVSKRIAKGRETKRSKEGGR